MTLNNTPLNDVPLNIYAGEEALKHIQQNGLCSDDISMLLGASSGPKWLTLQAIDEFLISDFFKGRTKPLHLLGTSAGAWRMATYAIDLISDNSLSHQRFTQAYIEQCYTEKPSPQEILDKCRSIIKELLQNDGIDTILNHPFAHYNIITSQCHGLTRSKSKSAKMLGFGIASLLNAFSRKTLSSQFTRVVMHQAKKPIPTKVLNDLPTRYHPFSYENFEDAILSTGSIPILIKGVEDVAGKGVYQDGGITDYGFDLPLLPENGFVLYPHFSKFPAPGWFDKSWFSKNSNTKKCVKRIPSHKNYAKTIMLVPSDEFISKLPNGKIPDRHDFLNFSDEERIANWTTCVKATQLLADDLKTMDWSKRVEALPW